MSGNQLIEEQKTKNNKRDFQKGETKEGKVAKIDDTNVELNILKKRN